jgi:acetylglutamate kinase
MKSPTETTLASGVAPTLGPIVLKIGGEVITSPALPMIARDIARIGSAVVVHGGGALASEVQRSLGQVPNIVGGRRITDQAALDVIKMVVAGRMNVDLCAALVAAGAQPVGLHGASSLVVRAVKRPPRVMPGTDGLPIDFGFVGDVTGVNAALLSLLLGAGFLPVLACLGADENGAVYNINADTVANGVATQLAASGMVLISDISGVMRDVNDPASRIAKLTHEDAKALIAEGVVTRGMIPKLEEAFGAIAAGVQRVFIVGRLREGDLSRAVLEPGTVGTVLVP